MKIIIAHPLQQHSYKTAESLLLHNYLHTYVTTIFYDQDKTTYKLLKTILPVGIQKRLESRKFDIPNSKIKTFSFAIGLLYLLFLRLDKNNILNKLVYRILIFDFGRKVAKYALLKNVDYVLMYDRTAYHAFKRIKKMNGRVKCILEMTSVPSLTINDILSKEISGKDIFSNNARFKIRQFSKMDHYRYKAELLLADYILSPSKFVKQSVINLGVNHDKIFNVKFGLNNNRLCTNKYLKVYSNKLIFFYAGGVETAKGVRYLLEAFKSLTELDVELVIAGTIYVKIDKYGLLNNVKILGYVSSDEMKEWYSRAHVYIMPSLYEGFSLTIIEALGNGLPVLASKNSGAEDIIENHKHGIVFDAGSVKAIKECVEWCNNNRDLLPNMSEAAIRIANKYTWHNYGETLVNNLEIIEGYKNG